MLVVKHPFSQVLQLDRSIPGFTATVTELFTSTFDSVLLGAIEELTGKIISYENM